MFREYTTEYTSRDLFGLLMATLFFFYLVGESVSVCSCSAQEEQCQVKDKIQGQISPPKPAAGHRLDQGTNYNICGFKYSSLRIMSPSEM